MGDRATLAANTRRAFDACLDGMGNAVTGKDSLLDTGALAEFIICFEGEPQLVTYVTAIRNRSGHSPRRNTAKIQSWKRAEELCHS